MLNPYLLMALLYLFVAILAAVDASFTNLNLLAWFNGLRWLRVHFITLGMATEAFFGVLPWLVAARRGLPRPKTRWDIWLALNVGLVILLVGIPIINGALIFTGGTLIFVAATLLAVQLWQMRGDSSTPARLSVRFYVMGLLYLLLGIIIGTGLWLGWSGPLRIQIPVEVHIHANNWGFLSLVFAGLLVDVVPRWSRRELATDRVINGIFWMMSVGALGLVIGPWLGGALWATVPGLVLHLSATIWLLGLTAVSIQRAGLLGRPGAWHLLLSYAWILAPVLVAPLILLGVPGFPGAGIEATAPQALIYGWVLQFTFALLPYFMRRFLAGEESPRLGGSWLSLLAVNVGSGLIWASIFLIEQQATLSGLGYGFFVLAMLPVAWEMGQISRSVLQRLELTAVPAAGD
jgi:cytochrome c oxidase cbb3-type subunit 1